MSKLNNKIKNKTKRMLIKNIFLFNVRLLASYCRISYISQSVLRIVDILSD